MKKELIVFVVLLIICVAVGLLFTNNTVKARIINLPSYSRDFAVRTTVSFVSILGLLLLYLIYFAKELSRGYSDLTGNILLIALNSSVFVFGCVAFYQVFWVGIGYWGIPKDNPHIIERFHRKAQAINLGLVIFILATATTLIITSIKTIPLLRQLK